MTIKEFIAKLMEMGFSPDAEIYVQFYGETGKLDDTDITKDGEGDLIIKRY